MRTIDQIINNALAALKRERANKEEEKAVIVAETRKKNAALWQPIVEGLKLHIPVELHSGINFDRDAEPQYWHTGEYNPGIRRRPVQITLPTPEGYTVFGYFYADNCYGFVSGVARYDDEDGHCYFNPTGERYGLDEYTVGQLSAFEIALAETIENYRPRVERKPPQEEAPLTVTERLEELIREIVQSEIHAD